MREHEDWREADPPDEVDRLFGRLEAVAPPPDLAERILARTSRRARFRWGVWVLLAMGVGLLSAGLAAVSGYLTGQELVRSGAYELLRLALEDSDLVRSAPGDYLWAVAEMFPWGGLLATLACILAAFAVARPLARAPRLLAAAGGPA